MTSFIGSTAALLVFVSGCACASHTQNMPLSPAATVCTSERDETLPSVKPVTPAGCSDPQRTSKPMSSPEIEVPDHMQIDCTPMELQ
jgi:hypothetical protein